MPDYTSICNNQLGDAGAVKGNRQAADLPVGLGILPRISNLVLFFHP